MAEIAAEIEAIVDPADIQDELSAMQAIAEGLNKLDVRARRRVLDWAHARYGRDPAAPHEAFLEFLESMLKAIGAHQSSTKQPRQIDRELWESTIKGTKYWTELPPDDAGDPGV